jgi:acyl-homoserine-lactone acylase
MLPSTTVALRSATTTLKTFVILLFSFSLTLPAARAQEDKNEILWDRYGVPHVYAHDLAMMYHEFGWAQMHNHANLILRLYGQARGRAAEYWGEKYLASDEQVQLFKVPALAEQDYASQDPVYKSFLESFVIGINAYAKANPDSISPENRQVLPVTPEDVIAHGIRVVYLRFVAGEKLGMASRAGKAGSNAYAIGPSRSVTKNALLLSNPHLPWGDLFTFFEAHLQAPGFNAYGVAVVGFPVLNIAFNDRLGWTHTVNPINASSLYELSVRGDSYLMDSTMIPFDKRVVTFRVKQTDGTLKEQSDTFRYSRHGPVVNTGMDKAIAIRIAGMENSRIFYEWHRMAAASNWRQFEDALKMMQIPMFNVIYADASGHIMYLFDGNVPRRTEGDWDFWKGKVDGRYSKYIWQQTLRYEELPKLFDPPTGFLQNANDPPWNCTWPALLDAHQYPSYLSSSGMGLRPQRAVNMIRKDSLITLEKLVDYKLNTGMEAADRFLPDLLTAVGKYPDSMALLAAGILSKWDRSCNAESRGAVLFVRWFDKLNSSMFLNPWASVDPTRTPSGLKDEKMAVQLLSQAAAEVIHDYDSLDVPWGKVYRFRIHQLDYPANGGPEQYGVYRTIYFAKDQDGKYRAVAGDSYVAVTEFGKNVRARVLLSYGNASQPGSIHIGDQLDLLSRKELRQAWLSKKDILANMEERQQF